MNHSVPDTSVRDGPDNDRAPQSQQASGGSGGEQLTHNINDTPDMRGSDSQAQPPGNRQSAGKDGGAPDSAATAANRTFQDTRGNQAGSTGTGLGAAQTGGNQDEFDMPKE